MNLDAGLLVTETNAAVGGGGAGKADQRKMSQKGEPSDSAQVESRKIKEKVTYSGKKRCEETRASLNHRLSWQRGREWDGGGGGGPVKFYRRDQKKGSDNYES